MKFRNILVPTDFSCESAKAYEFACDLARSNNSFLNLLHVVEPAVNLMEITYGCGKSQQELILNAEENLRRFASSVPSAGIKIFEVIRIGTPYEEILKFAKTKNIDLIVIATCPTRKGTVGEKLIKYSNVPVICVGTNEFLEHKNLSRFEIAFAENWVG